MSLKTKLMASVVGCGAMLATFGCGSSGGAGENAGTQSLRLQGSIPSSVRLLDNARVRAIGSDAKHYWSYVDAAGHFTITVKPGVSYRVLVTNAQRVGPDRVTGHLAVTTPTGSSKWLGIHSGGTIDLGVLSTTGAAASIHTKSEGEAASADAPGDAKGDDAETHEDDTDESGSACSDHDGKDDPSTTEDDDDLELKAEHDPGAQVHDDLEAEHADDKEDPGEKDDDQSCAAGGGGAAGGGAAPTTSAPALGTAQLGGACHVAADCTGALVCAASVCSTAVIR